MSRYSLHRASKALALLLVFVTAAAVLTVGTHTGTAAAGTAGGGAGSLPWAVMAFLGGSHLGDQASNLAAIVTQAAGQGVPLLKEVVDPFASDVQARVRTATGQAAAVMTMVRAIAGPAVKSLFDQFRNNPAIAGLPDGEYHLNLAQGHLTLSKRGTQIAIYFVVAGPDQSSGVVGISNANPLCPVHAQRMANDGCVATAFADIALDSNSFIQARMPLGGQGLPQVTARDFIEVGKQPLEISLGALDPDDTTVRAKLAVGLEATADSEISVKAGITAGVHVEVSPLKAGPLMAGAARAMERAAAQAGVRAPGTRMSPEVAATVLKAGLDYVLNAEAAQDLGDIGFEVDASCSIGAGILDSTTAVGSATGSICVSIPAANGLAITDSTIRDFLDGGRRLAPVFRRLGSAVVLRRADAHFMNSTLAQLEAAAQGAARTAANAFVQAASRSTLGLGFSVDLGTETAGSKSSGSSGGKGTGQAPTTGESPGGKDEAETSCTLFEISADIPLSAGVDEVLSGDAMRHTVVALASVARCMLPPPLGWSIAGGSQGQGGNWATLAQAVPADAEFSIRLSPGTPLVTVDAEMPARDMLTAMQVQNEASMALLGGLVSSVRQRSLAPLAAAEMSGALRDLFTDYRLLGLRKNGRFGISFGGGTSATVGAEVVAGGGFGFSMYAEVNPEMLLAYAVGSDLPDVTGEASVGFEIVEDAQGGLSLGEGVELSATAGLTTNMDFLCVRFKEWDQPLPPSTVNVAGFTVVDFEGTVNGDGSFSGSGRLLLPHGGWVYATFSVDAQGHVTGGSWSGSLTIGGRQFSVQSGTISDSGLHWTSTVFFPFTIAANSAGVSADVDCGLTSAGGFTVTGQVDINLAGSMRTFTIGLDQSGNIVATYHGQMTIGSRQIEVDVTMSPGGLRGTASLNLLGQTVTLDLRAGNTGIISGSGKTNVILFGQNAEVQVALNPDGSITGAASLTLNIGGQRRTFILTLDNEGALSGSCGGTVTIGGRTISNLRVTRFGATTKLTGQISFLGAQQVFDLTLNQGQITGGSGRAFVTLFGQTGELNLVLSPSGAIAGSGTVNLNIAGAGYRFDLTVDNQGNITGACAGAVNIGGRQISNLTLSRVNNQTVLRGQLNLAGSGVVFTMNLDNNGNLSGTYTGSVPFAGRDITGTFTLNPDGSITCSAGVKVKVAGVDRTFNLTVGSGGAVSGRYEGSFSIGGRGISSVVLNMDDTGVSGTGSIRLAGAQRTFNLSVDASGNVTGSYNGGISVGGFTISNEFRLQSDGSITCEGLAHLPVVGATVPFSVTVDASGNVSATLSPTHNGILIIGGKRFTNVSLTLNNNGMNGSGKFSILGSDAAFTLAASGTTGKVTGTTHVTLSATLPGDKEVKIPSVTLSLSEDGKISGSGTVKAANASITSASFEVDAGGNIRGTGAVKVKTLNVSCGFSLSPSSFSVWVQPPQGQTYSATKTVNVGTLSLTFRASLSLGVKETNKIAATAEGTVSAKDKIAGDLGSVGVDGDVNLSTGNVTVRVKISPWIDRNVTFAMPWALQ